ncbi:hypothetical protein SCP_0306880 [Sparassis crispa]|uniref:Uncharacterized protein n=1 Tax=Sparassis crispa TaxID=139825 RepID=A0A401GFR5_9APHY|nr:hypothetical protein SCP_0306880 [Sparassis crispa]GBE80965.1 hypothetical protein SCP_0306880 [Sparassis crispa]
MSYASVAAQNAPPPSAQPHPDPALLNTTAPSADNIADDAAKVNLVAPDFTSHPQTLTSLDAPRPQTVQGPPSPRPTNDVRDSHDDLWQLTKHYLFHPAVAGGSLGLINVGLISGAGYLYYSNPRFRTDTKLIASTVAAALSLGAAQSYAAEQYRKTPAGQEEERTAKLEGAALYRSAHEHFLRPAVLGGLLGVLNTAVLGTLGYFAYANWDRPHWDRRTVASISVALLTLWSGEAYLAERTPR